jgi:hypothetical protein
LSQGERSQLLEKLLGSYIVFSMVDEPPETENLSATCVDIGVCAVDFLSLLDHGPKMGHKIWSLDKRVCIGTLNLVIDGIDEMKAFIDAQFKYE